MPTAVAGCAHEQLGHQVARCFPSLYAALESLRIREALSLVFRRLTGSASLRRSRSIKNNFPQLGKRAYPRLESGQRYGSVQIEHAAFGLIFVRTD
jgi:hypothetical protein